jgi:hypothetical protein
MLKIDIQNLSNSWIEEHSSPNIDLPLSSKKYYAWEALLLLITENPENAWIIILKIINMSDDARVISNLSAGPLEDFISQHGDNFYDQISLEAKRNKKFLTALSGVWQNQTPDFTWERIRQLIKNRK